MIMAYWNHFAKRRFKEIRFQDVPVGGKFRDDFFNGNRRRKDIICIKTGELTYIEARSKKERSYIRVDENVTVSSFDQLID